MLKLENCVISFIKATSSSTGAMVKFISGEEYKVAISTIASTDISNLTDKKYIASEIIWDGSLGSFIVPSTYLLDEIDSEDVALIHYDKHGLLLSSSSITHMQNMLLNFQSHIVVKSRFGESPHLQESVSIINASRYLKENVDINPQIDKLFKEKQIGSKIAIAISNPSIEVVDYGYYGISAEGLKNGVINVVTQRGRTLSEERTRFKKREAELRNATRKL